MMEGGPSQNIINKEWGSLFLVSFVLFTFLRVLRDKMIV